MTKKISYDMEEIIARLESVASRLEDVQVRFDSYQTQNQNQNQAPYIFNRGGAAKLTTFSSPQQPNPQNETSPSLQAYNDLLSTNISQLIDASEAVGSEVLKATRILVEAFQEESRIIEAFSLCAKPTDPSQLQSLLQPTANKMMEASTLSSSRSPFANHLKVVGESAQALAWVSFQPGSTALSNPPSQHVEDAWCAAEFYANKILMEWKSKAPEHAVWVSAVKTLLADLASYCKSHYPTGPTWCRTEPMYPSIEEFMKSKDKKEEKKLSSAGEASKNNGKAPPPPPPPPPVGIAASTPTSTTTTAIGTSNKTEPMAALFAEINRGSAVTAGLRKVTDEMKSSKNKIPYNDNNSNVDMRTTAHSSKNAINNNNTRKVGRLECEQGRRWVIENWTDNQTLVIEKSDSDPKQTVYIYNVTNCTIQIKGKVNAITVDGCFRIGLVFDSVVSSCQLVNCTSARVQCTGVVPTMSIEKTDGCLVYLTREALNQVALTTAKASEINVAVVGGGPDGDEVEFAIPEQFVTRYIDGKMVTQVVTHSGG